MIGAVNQLRKAVFDKIRQVTGRNDVYTTVAPTGATSFILCSQFTQQDDSEKGCENSECTYLVEVVKDYPSGGTFSEICATGSQIMEVFTNQGLEVAGFDHTVTNIEAATEAIDTLPNGLRYRYLIRFNTLISRK